MCLIVWGEALSAVTCRGPGFDVARTMDHHEMGLTVLHCTESVPRGRFRVRVTFMRHEKRQQVSDLHTKETQTPHPHELCNWQTIMNHCPSKRQGGCARHVARSSKGAEGPPPQKACFVSGWSQRAAPSCPRMPRIPYGAAPERRSSRRGGPIAKDSAEQPKHRGHPQPCRYLHLLFIKLSRFMETGSTTELPHLRGKGQRLRHPGCPEGTLARGAAAPS